VKRSPLPLLLLLLNLCLPASAQQMDRRNWRLTAILFPTDQFGVYDLCLARRPAEAFTVTPRLPELHAAAQDQGTLKSFPAHLALLPSPVPMKEYGPLARIPGRSWVGLRWDRRGLKPGLYRLQVFVPCNAEDAAGRPVSFPTPAASLLIYLPCPDGLQAAQAKYGGRRVWMTRPLDLLGLDLLGAAGTDSQFAPQTSLCIKSITRVTQTPVNLAMNGGEGPGWDTSAADFVTRDPLRVVFDRPRRLQITAHGWAGPIEPPLRFPLFQDFADVWQLDRALRLTPPGRFQPLKLGMTPKQVIAALGWPTEYGSLAQLTQRASWRYDNLKPFYASVYFSHGKLVRYDPGGQLP